MTPAAPGIGFAIPSNTVRNIAGQLISPGKVIKSDRATLDITAQTAANKQGKPAGVAVAAVSSGGAADKAGIRPGDLIVGLNGEDTPSLQVLEGDLAEMKPGQKETVNLHRDGNDKQVDATLESLTS
jgi:putative serine protease PepD